MLIVSWSIPILASVLSFIIPPASSFMLSFGFLIFAFGDLSIFFFHFLVVVVLLHRKKKTKQLRARPVSMKLTIRMEVRVTCTLAIATGVFTICWVPPVIVLVFAAKTLKLNGPLHMWLQTLALSNSRPWTFWFTLLKSETSQMHSLASCERFSACSLCFSLPFLKVARKLQESS